MQGLLVTGLVYLELHIPEGARKQRPAPGRETFVPDLPVRVGGAMNVPSVLRALDAPVRLATPLGSGIAGKLLRSLAEDLKLPLLEWPSTRDASVSVVFHEEGDRAFLSTADFAALEAVAELPPVGWLHVPGLREARSLQRALSLARQRGTRISLNASWDPSGFELLLGGDALSSDLLVMNELEAIELAGSPDEALRLFSQKTPSVVITLGSGGAVGVFSGRRLEVSARSIEILDPTGAGDAFCAGLLAAVERGLPPETGLEWGTEAAARILTVYGGVLAEKLSFAREVNL